MASPVVQVRVPSGLLTRLDTARGVMTRSAWLLTVIEGALVAPQPEGPPQVQVSAVRVPGPAEAAGRFLSPARVTRSGPSGRIVKPQVTSDPAGLARCTHSGTRVIGGWCAACQRQVKPGGW